MDVTIANGNVTGTDKLGLREIIAKALHDKGYAVTIVNETSGYMYEHDPRRFKIYSEPGLGKPVYLMLGEDSDD